MTVPHTVAAQRERRAPTPQSRSRKLLLVSRAAALFHRAGVRAVSVEDIVLASGASRPTLYRYFPSKDDLVLACVEWQTARLFQMLDAAMATVAEPRAQVLAALRLFVGAAGHVDGGILAIDVAREFSDEDHPVRQAACKAIQQIHERLARPLTAALGGRAELITAQVVLLVLGARISVSLIGQKATAEILIASAERLLEDAGACSLTARP